MQGTLHQCYMEKIPRQWLSIIPKEQADQVRKELHEKEEQYDE